MASARRTVLDVTSTNSTSVGSLETSADILNDRINLIAATTFLGITYGVMFTLYCTTTYSLFTKLCQRKEQHGSHPHILLKSRIQRRKTLFYIVYTFVLFVLATLYTAGNSQNAIVAYIDNRTYPEGPYQYFITYMAGQSSMVITDVTYLIILWMTDALILCRFIMFYYKVPYARWIIPLPCAMYVGVAVLSTLVLRGEVGLGKIFYLTENMVLAYYALSFSLNVLATVLIAARLFWHKVQLERVFGPRIDSPYRSIATILIESAALYGVWSLVFLILCVLQSPEQTLILATMSQIQVISPLLIILWMARGKAWNDGESTGQDDDENDGLPNLPPSSSAGRLSFGSRPTRIMSKLSLDDDTPPGPSRNASWTTVGEGGGVEHDVGEINMVELGFAGSKPPSLLDHLEA